MLESIYEEAICYELEKLNLPYKRQYGLLVKYDGIILPNIGFRADVIVDSKLIIEIKSVEHIVPVFAKTLLTYLRLSDMRLGLLVNFNVDLIKNGITRVVNGL